VSIKRLTPVIFSNREVKLYLCKIPSLIGSIYRYNITLQSQVGASKGTGHPTSMGREANHHRPFSGVAVSPSEPMNPRTPPDVQSPFPGFQLRGFSSRSGKAVVSVPKEAGERPRGVMAPVPEHPHLHSFGVVHSVNFSDFLHASGLAKRKTSQIHTPSKIAL